MMARRKNLSLAAAGGLASFAALSYSSAAHALGPVDVEVAARVGYATSPDFRLVPGNPYGLGLGGRAGLSGIYYVGGSSPTWNGLGTSFYTAMEGFEAGYALPIPFVKIRPQIGIGNSTLACSSGCSISENSVYLEPGVLVMVPLGMAFVGADVNALVLPSYATPNVDGPNPSKAYASLSVHGQVGIRF